MRKYIQLLKNWLSRIFMYRVRLLIWFFTDIVNIGIFPFIWLSIFSNRVSLGGYDRNDLVTYYLVAVAISTIASSHLADTMYREIKTGDLNTSLVKPVSYLLSQSVHEIAYKIFTTFLTMVGVLILLFFAPSFIKWPSSFLTIALFSVAFLLSFIMSQLVQIAIGLSSVWLGEISALNQVRRITEAIFSGELAPLTFFPIFVQKMAVFLPFPYFTYVPAQIFLGKISLEQALPMIGYGIGWAVALFIALKIVWRRALLRYDGTGI